MKKISKIAFLVSVVLAIISYVLPQILSSTKFFLPIMVGFGIVEAVILPVVVISGIIWLISSLRNKGQAEQNGIATPADINSKRRVLAGIIALGLVVVVSLVILSAKDGGAGLGILLLLPPIWIIPLAYVGLLIFVSQRYAKAIQGDLSDGVKKLVQSTLIYTVVIFILLVVWGRISSRFLGKFETPVQHAPVVETRASREERSWQDINDAFYSHQIITSYPATCFSWTRLEVSGDWVTWQAAWKQGNSCPTSSSDAPVIPKAKVNIQTHDVVFQSLDGEYR